MGVRQEFSCCLAAPLRPSNANGVRPPTLRGRHITGKFFMMLVEQTTVPHAGAAHLQFSKTTCGWAQGLPMMQGKIRFLETNYPMPMAAVEPPPPQSF